MQRLLLSASLLRTPRAHHAVLHSLSEERLHVAGSCKRYVCRSDAVCVQKRQSGRKMLSNSGEKGAKPRGSCAFTFDREETVVLNILLDCVVQRISSTARVVLLHATVLHSLLSQATFLRSGVVA